MKNLAGYIERMDKLTTLAQLAAQTRKAAAAYENWAARRDALIREIGDDHTLAVLANAAGISHSRVSHIVGNRGAKVGRPRRDAGIEPRQPGRRPKEEG